MKKTLLTGIAALSLATGTAHANSDPPYPKPVKTIKFQGLPAKPPHTKRECLTPFDSSGIARNTTETKNCIKNWNATIAYPSKGHWLWKWPPPAEYDIPYTGVLMTQRLPIDQLHKVCAPNQMACTMVVSIYPGPNGAAGSWQISLSGNRAACIIIMPPDDYIWQHNQDPKEVLRHETGHCNGWTADHPNSQSKWEWVEK
jgi:hypothetical protein